VVLDADRPENRAVSGPKACPSQNFIKLSHICSSNHANNQTNIMQQRPS